MPMRKQTLCLTALLVAQCFLAAKGQSATANAMQATHLAEAIQACDDNTAACHIDLLPPDRTVTLDNHVEALQNYAWLRAGIARMNKANPMERHRLAEALLRHLRDDQPTVSATAALQARHEADVVLANVEFAKARPSWLQQQWEYFQEWLRRHTQLPGAATSNFLRFLLELILFAVPLLALGLWLMRQVREERLRPAQPDQGKLSEARRRVDWLSAATGFAAQQQWREAVHALYWHSISVLEQKRVIALSHTRTPREYLSLLPSGATQRASLRELTLLLESSWYGEGIVVEDDYRRAEQLTRAMATA